MKIEDIKKACELYNDLEAINEVLELKKFVDTTLLSPILVLFHNNERYNINSLLSEAAKTKIMNIIFSYCEARAKQIKQEIEEL